MPAVALRRAGGGALDRLAPSALLQRLQPLIPRGDRSFLSAAADGPMLVGSWRPIVVLPVRFECDFPPEQQALMLAHESAHRARGDAQANALAALAACVFWFNPLIWFALRCFQFDQELACDASVIEARPQARRAYAQATLQTQLAGQGGTLKGLLKNGKIFRKKDRRKVSMPLMKVCEKDILTW